MTSEYNTQWVLTSRPSGVVERGNFDVRRAPIPEPTAGQVLVRNIYLLVPPSMRLWMNHQDVYLTAGVGEVMLGLTLGVVTKSSSPRVPEGTIVNSMGGWQEYALLPAKHVTPIDPDPTIPLAYYRTVLDIHGLTAYCGLTEIGRPKDGETLVVTAAAGSVGSLVCQLGKRLGLRVIGVAGGQRKCDWLRECGIDGAIDYQDGNVAARLEALCPDGVDIHFENVGGPVMADVMNHLNPHARIALCGIVTSYYGGGAGTDLGPCLQRMVTQRATMEGFMVTDFMGRRQETVDLLEPWLRDGSLRHRVEISEGLDTVLATMDRVRTGVNWGAQLVRICDEPS